MKTLVTVSVVAAFAIFPGETDAQDGELALAAGTAGAARATAAPARPAPAADARFADLLAAFEAPVRRDPPAPPVAARAGETGLRVTDVGEVTPIFGSAAAPSSFTESWWGMSVAPADPGEAGLALSASGSVADLDLDTTHYGEFFAKVAAGQGRLVGAEVAYKHMTTETPLVDLRSDTDAALGSVVLVPASWLTAWLTVGAAFPEDSPRAALAEEVSWSAAIAPTFALSGRLTTFGWAEGAPALSAKLLATHRLARGLDASAGVLVGTPLPGDPDVAGFVGVAWGF